MYVLLTLILATLAVWVVVDNILMFFIKKYEKAKEKVLLPRIDKTQDFVINPVDKIEEAEALDLSQELEEEPELLGEQIDLSKDELKQVVKDKNLAYIPVTVKGDDKLIEEKLVAEDAQKLIIEKLELKIRTLEEQIRTLKLQLKNMEVKQKKRKNQFQKEIQLLLNRQFLSKI